MPERNTLKQSMVQRSVDGLPLHLRRVLADPRGRRVLKVEDGPLVADYVGEVVGQVAAHVGEHAAADSRGDSRLQARRHRRERVPALLRQGVGQQRVVREGGDQLGDPGGALFRGRRLRRARPRAEAEAAEQPAALVGHAQEVLDAQAEELVHRITQLCWRVIRELLEDLVLDVGALSIAQSPCLHSSIQLLDDRRRNLFRGALIQRAVAGERSRGDGRGCRG
mmetsp:Transcript_36088/g.101593  ORF Transcript_36088/g.101593 Transcript_36088/m.101593 type:complete len:223 (+) Transcript_36088:29-697(+)